jgi:hypothetical protein
MEMVSWLRLISYQLSMIIGIDNGSCSGAMVALTGEGDIMGYTKLPSKRADKKQVLDLEQFVEWIIDWEEPIDLVAVEQPLHFARSIQAMRSMALCYGHLEGVCYGMQWEHVGIGVREWQNAMLGYFAKGQSKQAAWKAAIKLAPTEEQFSVDSNKRRAKPHDGVVDAYLIGKYALKNKWKKG